MARIILFDLNETLLDPGVLDPHFQRVFGDAGVRKLWFRQVIESALVATITDVYVPFEAIQRAALTMIAAQQGLSLSEQQAEPILAGMRSLPAYPDVRPGLDLLRQGGLRLVVLTNSSSEAVTAQLANAGLTGYFEAALPTEAVRRFKPHAEAYRMAAQYLDVETADLRLVAAHAWDITGAVRAGCTAAFVARPGKVLDPLGGEPDIIGNDLPAVATQILAAELTAHPSREHFLHTAGKTR